MSVLAFHPFSEEAHPSPGLQLLSAGLSRNSTSSHSFSPEHKTPKATGRCHRHTGSVLPVPTFPPVAPLAPVWVKDVTVRPQGWCSSQLHCEPSSLPSESPINLGHAPKSHPKARDAPFRPPAQISERTTRLSSLPPGIPVWMASRIANIRQAPRTPASSLSCPFLKSLPVQYTVPRATRGLKPRSWVPVHSSAPAARRQHVLPTQPLESSAEILPFLTVLPGRHHHLGRAKRCLGHSFQLPKSSLQNTRWITSVLRAAAQGSSHGETQAPLHNPRWACGGLTWPPSTSLCSPLSCHSALSWAPETRQACSHSTSHSCSLCLAPSPPPGSLSG